MLLRSVLTLIALPSTALGYPLGRPAVNDFRAAGPTVQRGSHSTMDTLVPAEQPHPAIRREFRWPRSRRRLPSPPHSRSSTRLKQETPRPPQFPQDGPSFPAGSEIRTSASPPR